MALGLGLNDLRLAQTAIQHIRAASFCELTSACLIRSELQEAEQHLADLISFIRSCDSMEQENSSKLWNQYSSRVTLLHGHLAQARGQSQRALDCYRLVSHSEEEGSLLWGMGMLGEITLRIGLIALRGTSSEQEFGATSARGGKLWKEGEKDALIQMSSGVLERCLSGIWGEHMAAVGRLITASLSDEIVRAKYVLSTPYHWSSFRIFD